MARTIALTLGSVGHGGMKWRLLLRSTWMVLAGTALAAVSTVTFAQDAAALRSAAALDQVLVNAIEKAGKSIVAIARVDPQEAPRNGDRFQPRPRSPADPDFVPDHFGTGVVVDRAGFIVTQYHVVGVKSEHYVTTTEGHVYRATIQGADPRSDLAVLKLDPTDLTRNGEYLTAIQFGDTSKLKRGQSVVALGNPYAIAADGQASASRGIIANLSRKIPPSGGEGANKDKLYHFGTLIQTDAKLNLGTSGGALVNMSGEMIGLTTSLAATAGYEQAAGYAIPVDDVFVRAVEAMKQGREVEYGFLGVLPESLALDERDSGAGGVRVSNVVPGTPAERSGLQTGDVITYVDQNPIRTAESLMLAVGRKPVESVVRVTILRDKKPRNFEVRLTKFPVRGAKIITLQPPAWRGLRVDYATASDELQRVRNTELLRGGCVLITDVERDSPAWEAKLRPGMFISEIGGAKVTSPKDYHTAILGKNGRIELKVFDAEQIKTPESRVLLPASS